MYKGKNIELRALKEEDFNFILDYVNDYDVYASFTDSPVIPKTECYQREWFKGENKSIITFAISLLDSGKIIGTCQLRAIDSLLDNALLSIIIGEKSAHGKGYGSEALDLLLNFAFNELNLHKVSLFVFSFNHGAIRLYEKCGFKKEGILEMEIYKNGIYYDEIKYSILDKEYREFKKNKGGK